MTVIHDPNNRCLGCSAPTDVPGWCVECIDLHPQAPTGSDRHMDLLGVPPADRYCPQHGEPLVIRDRPGRSWECGCRDC